MLEFTPWNVWRYVHPFSVRRPITMQVFENSTCLLSCKHTLSSGCNMNMNGSGARRRHFLRICLNVWTTCWWHRNVHRSLVSLVMFIYWLVQVALYIFRIIHMLNYMHIEVIEAYSISQIVFVRVPISSNQYNGLSREQHAQTCLQLKG